MSKDEEFILERVDRPSRSVIDSYVCESRPFIITGTAKDWPAYKLWKDPRYLIEKVGKETLVPVRTHFIKYSNPEEWLGEAKEIPFAQFMEHWLQKKTWTKENDTKEEYYYLASLPMNKHFTALCNDVVVPEHASEQKKSGNLWIGNAGQITPVHYDFSTGDPGMDGLHAVLMGRKTFRLFDPQKNAQYFPRKNQWGRFHQALVDIATGFPDPSIYPMFANAKYIEIDLREGEILFIPKLWWHHVVTEEPRYCSIAIERVSNGDIKSVSVNYWFQHLGSEKLKITRHWIVMEEYLKMVEKMDITREKMKNVLQFYGMKNVTDETVDHYLKNIHEFMLLPQFIATFANGTRAPWIVVNPEAKTFEKEITAKVKDWIELRVANKKQ